MVRPPDKIHFMQRILSISILLAFFALDLRAQDPVFSQFYASPLQPNPAFAGTTYAPRIAINYRNQWPSIPRAYETFSVSYEQFLEELNSGFGLLVATDKQGDGLISTNVFKAVYGYRVSVNRDFAMKIGIEVGGGQTRYDWNRFVFPDQLNRITGAIDPLGNANPTEETRPDALNNSFLDIGAGLLAYTPLAYGGLSIKHLNTFDESIIETGNTTEGGRPIRLSVHGGAQFDLGPQRNGEGAFISPNVLLIKQGTQGQINTGAYLGWKNVFGGLWYRHTFNNPDAAIVLLGYQYDLIKVGYSFDLTVSDLTYSASGGAHEISVVFNFDNSESVQRSRRRSRYNDCFRLFR